MKIPVTNVRDDSRRGEKFSTNINFTRHLPTEGMSTEVEYLVDYLNSKTLSSSGYSSNNLCKSKSVKESEGDLSNVHTSAIDKVTIPKIPLMLEKRSISDDSSDGEDVCGWSNKCVKSWSTSDTIYWLLEAGIILGIPYAKLPRGLLMTGEKLFRLNKKQFRTYSEEYGEKLYDLLHKKKAQSKNIVSSFHNLKLEPDVKVEKDSSEHKIENSTENCTGIKRRGRPPKKQAAGIRKKRATGQKLWEFLICLLHDPYYCPRWIRWENYEERTFRFVENHSVAKLWGSRKPSDKKKPMNFEKFTRAMRYYYEKEILQDSPTRLVYKFGKKATGFETDNPNFEKVDTPNKETQIISKL